jgi:hypothetical protein
MRRLSQKLALAAGSALVAGALLVVAYLAAGTAILAFLLTAVFWIGGDMVPRGDLFAPIGVAALIVLALASWGLTALGTGAWWLWRPRGDEPPRQ